MNLKAIKEGEQIALRTILELVGLGLIKLAAGLITGMTVIVADAMTTFADTLGMFASYFGLKLSHKSADANFSYGYYKIETFAAFVVSVSIVVLGGFLLVDSIDLFFEPNIGKHQLFAITATLLAIHHSYHLYHRLKIAADKSNSLALLASAKDKKMDVFAGIAVLISIVANYQNIPYVEGVVSTMLALVVLKTGLESSKESLFFLLDYWNDPKLKRQIHKVLIEDHSLVTAVKHLRLRRAGTYIFGEAFVEINPFADFTDLREELDILQKKINELSPYIKDFSIYTHIAKVKKLTIAVPLKSGRSLSGVVADNICSTSGYLMVHVKGHKVTDTSYKKITEAEKKTVELNTFLTKNGVDILIDNKLNSLTYYYLRRTNHILIYPNFSDIKSARQTIDLLLIDN